MVYLIDEYMILFFQELINHIDNFQSSKSSIHLLKILWKDFLNAQNILVISEATFSYTW